MIDTYLLTYAEYPRTVYWVPWSNQPGYCYEQFSWISDNLGEDSFKLQVI